MVFKVDGTPLGGGDMNFQRGAGEKTVGWGRWNCEGGVGAITVKCDVGVGRKAGKTGRLN